jgi:hypothetical protein
MSASRIHATQDKSAGISAVTTLWTLCLADIIWTGLTVCGCGYAGKETGYVAVPVFVWASVVFFRFPRKGRIAQIFAALAYAFISLILIKYIGDFLVFGHR